MDLVTRHLTHDIGKKLVHTLFGKKSLDTRFGQLSANTWYGEISDSKLFCE